MVRMGQSYLWYTFGIFLCLLYGNVFKMYLKQTKLCTNQLKPLTLGSWERVGENMGIKSLLNNNVPWR